MANTIEIVHTVAPNTAEAVRVRLLLLMMMAAQKGAKAASVTK